jgi:hypothetical protein
MGPSLDEKDPTAPDCYVSGMQEACYAGNVEVLKKLKPEAGRDDLENLLHCAAVSGRRDAIRYLLDLGARANDKQNGGSSALDAFIWRLGFPSFNYGFKTVKSKYAVSNEIANISELAQRGAVWKPDSRSSINSLRRNLYECEAGVTIDLLRVLMKYGACSMEQARELLNHPRMREHLASESRHLARLKLDIEDKQSKGRQAPPAYLLAQYNREELYEKVWSLPTREVAKHYGFSDVRLGKLCKILKVPKPGRGYWAKKEAGKPTPKRPALPSLETLKAG